MDIVNSYLGWLAYAPPGDVSGYVLLTIIFAAVLAIVGGVTAFTMSEYPHRWSTKRCWRLFFCFLLPAPAMPFIWPLLILAALILLIAYLVTPEDFDLMDWAKGWFKRDI